MEFRYPTIRSKQTDSEKWLAQFAAPAPDINLWAGVPQKKRFGSGEETAGFQREENSSRIRSLQDFYTNPENLIQNPLLCALRNIPLSSVRFEPYPGQSTGGRTEVGEIIINAPEFGTIPLVDIFGLVRGYIEERVPDLKNRQPDEAVIASLRTRAAEVGHFEANGQDSPDDERESDGEGASESENSTEEDPSGVLFEESHIADFWSEVSARHEVMKQISPMFDGGDFLGFTKDALLSYVRPVVLVDGQHRLKGALSATREIMKDPSIEAEIENRITGGESWEAVDADLVRRKGRLLPISLLMSSDPAEQVFQFVVVNQKATPIGRALLGTIVSTTLSANEMDSVATRLKKAGIQLEESQAITYLARHPGSPFFGLVERGLAGDAKDLLQWNVFASLIGIFRHLRGGRIFGQRNDYAEIWSQRYLPSSEISESQDSILPLDASSRLADIFKGLAHVCTLDEDAPWYITNSLGKEWSCFNGASRVYWPFTNPHQNAFLHPLFTQEFLLRKSGRLEPYNILENSLAKLVFDASCYLSEDHTFRDFDRQKLSEQLKGARSIAQHTNDYSALEKLYAMENDRLEAESKLLHDENRNLRWELDQLKIVIRSSGRSADDEKIGETGFVPLTIEEAFERAKTEFRNELLFGDQVADQIRGARENAGPPDKVYHFFEELAKLSQAYRDADGRLGKTVVQWLHERGVPCSGESETKKAAGLYRWPIQGEQRAFELLLKPNEATSTDRCIRIYFDTQLANPCVVVGFVGSKAGLT
jgi:hypothetical protein